MSKHKVVKAVGYCCGSGGAHPNCCRAPLVLQYSVEFPATLQWHAMLHEAHPETQLEAIPAISMLCQQLANITDELTAKQQPFIVFGGDQTASIGTWSGVAHALHPQGAIGLIWIDAHMDSHTPITTETGNLHGMSLAALLGHGDARLTSILNEHSKLLPENVCLIGVRSFEENEANLLKRLNVRVYFIEEVKQRGFASVLQEAIAQVKKNTVGYGLSIDIDSIDPVDAPGVSVPAASGIRANDLLEGLQLLQHDEKLIATEIVEFNPTFDQNQKTEKLIGNIVKVIYF